MGLGAPPGWNKATWLNAGIDGRLKTSVAGPRPSHSQEVSRYRRPPWARRGVQVRFPPRAHVAPSILGFPRPVVLSSRVCVVFVGLDPAGIEAVVLTHPALTIWGVGAVDLTTDMTKRNHLLPKYVCPQFFY